MLLREIFIGGARAPPAPPHATALSLHLKVFKKNSVIKDFFSNYSAYLISSLLSSTLQFKSRKM